MDIKTLLNIEETVNQEQDFIGKARFLANQIDNEYFVQPDAAKNIAARYQTLKSAFQILFDYIVYADDGTKKVKEIVSEAFDKVQEVQAA